MFDFNLKLRIGFVIATLMIALALAFDGLKFLIGILTAELLAWMVNPFINFSAQLVFLLWFSFLGVSFTKPGKLLMAKILAVGIPSFAGIIPVLGDIFPYWTSGVIINIAIVYAEDLLEAVSPPAVKSIARVVSNYKNKKTLLKTAKVRTEMKISPKELVFDKNGEKGVITRTEYGKRVDWGTSIKQGEGEGESLSTPNKDRIKVINEITPKNNNTRTQVEEIGNLEKEKAPQYQEFDQKSGRLVPTNIGGEEKEDWPIAA